MLLCDTTQLRTRGLQGFRTLRADEAALFIFDKPEEVSFWMGSVSYAIDIIFVGPDEKVVRTYADRRPGSRDLYPSGQAIKWVVETAAGSGIKAGDRVQRKCGFRIAECGMKNLSEGQSYMQLGYRIVRPGDVGIQPLMLAQISLWRAAAWGVAEGDQAVTEAIEIAAVCKARGIRTVFHPLEYPLTGGQAKQTLGRDAQACCGKRPRHHHSRRRRR